jgi:hypothetical protein
VAAWFAPGQSRNAVSELITDGVDEATARRLGACSRFGVLRCEQRSSRAVTTVPVLVRTKSVARHHPRLCKPRRIGAVGPWGHGAFRTERQTASRVKWVGHRLLLAAGWRVPFSARC